MKLKEGVSFADIADGSVIYKANDVLAEVARNILDPNTAAKTVREITIKVRFHPNENRDLVMVSVDARPKLAPMKPALTALFLAQKVNGEIVMSEKDARQENLFDEDAKAPKTPKHLAEARARREDEKDDEERDAAE
jgi:hypothetical protein